MGQLEANFLAPAPGTQLLGRYTVQSAPKSPKHNSAGAVCHVKGRNRLGGSQFSVTCRELLIFEWLQAREGPSSGNPKSLAAWPYRLCEQVIDQEKTTWIVTDRVLEGNLQGEGPRGAAGKNRGFVGGARRRWELREIPAAPALNLPSAGHRRCLCPAPELVRSDHQNGDRPTRNLWKPWGSGDSSHVPLCHSRCRIATTPFRFPKHVNTHNAVSCPRQLRWSPKGDGETEVPREDKLATEPRVMSFSWPGRPPGDTRWPTCLPPWLGPGNRHPSRDALSHPLFECPGPCQLAGEHRQQAPACLCWGKHGCLGTGVSIMGQQISDDLGASAHCSTQASATGHC